MARPLATVLLAFTLLLAACRGGAEPPAATPTPFAVTPAVPRITTAAPIPITLENLAANPDFFVGATLQLSGGFRRLPRQVCAGETFRSPATWGLEADGYLAGAAGMDEQLRALLDEGQAITVEGQWLKFSGPVGCGPAAAQQDIWYLSVDRVLDPNPLVGLPAQSGQEAAPATAVAEAAPSPTESSALPTAVPFTPTAPPPTSAPLIPPTAVTAEVITATATISATATLAVTPLSTGTPSGSLSPTPTTSATAGGPTATPGTVTATSTLSATPPNGNVVDQGSVDFEDLRIASLPEGVTHRWNVDLGANDILTLIVAPASTANITLSLLAPDGSALVSAQNQAPLGEPETIRNQQITAPGQYRLLVTTSPAAATAYALMAMDSDSYSFDLRGTLRTNALRSDSLPANQDHFWFFTAESGQSLSFTVTPQDNGDPYVELYDPSGSRILTIDNAEGGDAESLDGYTLLSSGMFGIRVAEFDFQPMSYQIILSSP